MKKRSLLSLIPVLFIAVSCSQQNLNPNEDIKVDGWADEETVREERYVNPNSITIDSSTNFHTAVQEAYIQSSWDMVYRFASGTAELSIPGMIKIDLSEEQSKTYIQVAEDAEFTVDSRVFLTNGDVAGFYNFKLGQTYYRRCSDSFDFSDAESHHFTTTATGPRNLFVEGVTNVRDLGGYESKLGGKIKQGMYYLGGKLTSGSSGVLSRTITDKGLNMLTGRLGCKTEIDLRMVESIDGTDENGGQYNGFLKGLNYISVSVNYNVSNLMLEKKEELKQVFKTYAVADNYPIYVHCSIGTDRTGVVSYLMGALLGMKYNDLYKDYLFSNFGNISGSRDETAPVLYQNTLKKYGKKTLAECCEAYLIDIGLTAQEVQNIRDIMIEKQTN